MSGPAWQQSWRSLKHCGEEVRDREGIAKPVQLWRLLSMSLAHGVPPGEAYAFTLYRPGGATRLWDYVFTHEAQAFHRQRDAYYGGTAASEGRNLLQDKAGLADLLGSRGIAVVPVRQMVPRGASFDPGPHLEACPRLFLKPRCGSASRATFIIEKRDDGHTCLHAVHWGMRDELADWSALEAAMAECDFIVQPLMANHPDLAALAPSGDAITLRIITERHGHDIRTDCAILEIPLSPDRGHILLPITPASGVPGVFPRESLPAHALSDHEADLARVCGKPLPGWKTLSQEAAEAHRQVPGIFSIAWDYLICPEGPRLLEGNSGWRTTVPQKVLGGYLQRNPLEQ